MATFSYTTTGQIDWNQEKQLDSLKISAEKDNQTGIRTKNKKTLKANNLNN
jgi:hypothetical protein